MMSMTVSNMAKYAIAKQDFDPQSKKNQNLSPEEKEWRSSSQEERHFRNLIAAGGDPWMSPDYPGAGKEYIIPVSKDIEALARKEIRDAFLKNQGFVNSADAESYSKKFRDYAKSQSGPERRAIMYTIDQIGKDEVSKIEQKIKSVDTNWSPRQSFDPKIIQEYLQEQVQIEGIDQKV